MVDAARQTGLAPGQRPAAAGLAEWAARTGRRHDAEPPSGGLRFAFYGRVSTEDWQDPVTSRARQLDQATALTAGYGRITGEYFDEGQSLETPRDPDRVSSFLNIRVKDIEAVYAEWSARGAEFLTPPKQHQFEKRCYIRDPDGHLIEVGQTTDPEGDWSPDHWPSSTPAEESE